MKANPSVIAFVALACALPAAAQQGYSSSTATTVTGPASSAAITPDNGNTNITGSTASDNAATPALDDQATLRHVAAALANDPQLAGASIDVRVDKGRVTLSGTTRNLEQSERARDLAANVSGVSDVDSRLSLK